MSAPTTVTPSVDRAARKRAYYEAHKAEAAARNRAYYEAHKAEAAARNRAYREAHKAEVAARNRARYAAVVGRPVGVAPACGRCGQHPRSRLHRDGGCP